MMPAAELAAIRRQQAALNAAYDAGDILAEEAAVYGLARQVPALLAAHDALVAENARLQNEVGECRAVYNTLLEEALRLRRALDHASGLGT